MGPVYFDLPQPSGRETMTGVLLVRHGQTEWNREQVFRGRADIPLSETGLKQAEALGRRLADERLSAVYSSPLNRALVTAEHLTGTSGFQPQAVDGLTDMSYGEWEGWQCRQVEQQYPELYACWLSEPHLVRPPGGEMLAEVRERATAALEEIIARHPRATVAVVSHRVVNKVLLCAALGLGDDAFWRIRQDTCCLNVMEHDGTGLSVCLLNDTCHLRGLEKDRADF
jgi:broad specificity phosphatase PhoE